MNILLIAPPWSDVYRNYKAAARVGMLYPPLSLLYLGTVLKRKGHSVTVIDAEERQLRIDDIVRLAKECRPDVIGVTATSPIFKVAKDIISAVKMHLDVPVILGGPHITVLPLEAMRECEAVDYGVYGEGEDTVVELIDMISSSGDAGQIRGLLYRKGGEVIKNPPRPFISDLDTISIADRSFVDMHKYTWSVPRKGIVPFATVITGRGCPYLCIFCSQRTIFGSKVRFRGVENVLEELKYIYWQLGIRHIQFCDETLTLSRERVLKLCQAIKDNKLDITWEGYTRANLIDEKMLREMKAAGFVRIAFGIESGNPEILKKIKKGINLDEVKEAYKIAKKVGLETRASLMIGHPFETRKTAMESLRFAQRLKECDQIHINVSTPYPGTELYDMAQAGIGGLRLLTRDLSEYNRYGNAVIEVNDLKRADLISLQKKGFRMFYFTPRRIFYNLKRAGFKAGVRNAWAFLNSIK